MSEVLNEPMKGVSMSDKTEAIDQERQSVSTPEHTARNAEVSRTVAGFGRSAPDRRLLSHKKRRRAQIEGAR